jgi:exopolyphosphatase/guanosine-5'-triphosphate,3'-diphosphate pyrophosphatase
MIKLAAIDIGTNSVLLLIASGGAALRPLQERCTITRLGRGVDASGRLDPAAIGRTLAALETYRALIDREQVSAVAAVGTSALRDAENAAAFLEPARALLGVPVQIIGGEREAELTIAGVRTSESYRDLPASALIFDVGGGSTELIEVGPREADRPLLRSSLDIGSVRLTERLVRSDPPDASVLAALERCIDDALDGLPQRSHLRTPRALVGVAGTATTVLTVQRGIEPYDSEQVNGATLGAQALGQVIARLCGLPLAARRELAGLEPERADVIIAGALIVERIVRRFGGPDPQLGISDRGVRWGLLAELAA